MKLTTDRLELAPHTLADVDECAAMWRDPDVTKHIGGRPFSSEETWARVLRYAGHWQLLGFGYFAVREKASGKFVGDVGLADFRSDMTPELVLPEAGWALATWAHGKGYATEALRAVLEATKVPRTACIIDDANVKSFAVAARCSYRASHRAVYRGAEVVVLTR
jgi:RimJ/RimL family protein N-acetyltransferase